MRQNDNLYADCHGNQVYFGYAMKTEREQRRGGGMCAHARMDFILDIKKIKKGCFIIEYTHKNIYICTHIKLKNV